MTCQNCGSCDCATDDALRKKDAMLLLQMQDAAIDLAAQVKRLEAERIETSKELSNLQKALAFWLPHVPDESSAIADRIASDAYLLYGLTEYAEPCAERIGWISLAKTVEGK